MVHRIVRALILVVVPATALADATVPVSSPRLVYTTYAGTGPNSVLRGLGVDAQGYSYLVGSGPGAGDTSCGFVTKLSQTASATVWSVCLPLSEVEGVALDASGYIYVVGSNPPVNFVNTSLVMKLSPDAQHTIYSTQIGGTYGDTIAVDLAGNAYISGSSDSSFKATPGAYMTSGGLAFAVKLNAAGSIEYATYLDLFGGHVAADSKGQAWVVGTTCPAEAGAVGSNCDTIVYGTAAAIRKLDASGAHLLVSKSFGGGSSGHFLPAYYDRAAGVAVDATDSVWIMGTAQTSAVPTSPNALEPERPGTVRVGGGGIGYALKLSSSGDLLYGTYVGNQGGQDHTINSVALDRQGRPYFALNTGTFATDGGTATVIVLGADGSSLLVSTGFNSFVENVALDGSVGLYVAGYTSRLAFLTTPGTDQALYPGGQVSGYAAKFDLSAPAPAQFSVMVNGASMVAGDNPVYPEGAVTPGEIVTLYGTNLPSNPKVTFDGRAAPILYADAKQINTVVPFEVSAPSTVVFLEGVRGYVLPVWPAVPGLFTADGSGGGQLAALNEDGTVNSSANPAKAGSVVAVYMTGVGAMTPPIGDGQLGPLQPPYPAPVLGTSATANGVGAPVFFAGQAPGLIAGAVQVNVQIPANTSSGNAALTVYIGNYQTQIGGTTVAVAR